MVCDIWLEAFCHEMEHTMRAWKKRYVCVPRCVLNYDTGRPRG